VADFSAAAIPNAERYVVIGCVLLLLGPMGVIVWGVADDGSDALYALAFLVPFVALLVLWCLPGVSRGVRGNAVAGAPVPSSKPGSEKTTATEQKTGFDECGLIEPDELAAALSVDAMFVSGRSVMTASDEGARRATCSYCPENEPGALGMEVTIPDGTPEGRCADFALSSAAEVVGAELTMARSVPCGGDDMNCYFSGGNASLRVTLHADSQWSSWCERSSTRSAGGTEKP
jgi:hypothetical protein